MSSYVIFKSEYIKAAGLVAGIAESRRLWVYDYEAGRNSTDEDYYNRFSECYTMNAISVAEQYHDESTETDPNEYRDIFDEYKKIGKFACTEYDKENDIIYELRKFFSSATYQTEKQAYFFKMKMYFNTILVELMEFLTSAKHECNSWGEIDIETEEA